MTSTITLPSERQIIAIAQKMQAQLLSAARQTRMLRWIQGMLLYDLFRLPPGFNSDEAYAHLAGDYKPLYQYVSDARTQEEYIEQELRVSKASAYKWIRLHEIYVLKFGIARDDDRLPFLMETSIDRLASIAPTITSVKDAIYCITQAHELKLTTHWVQFLVSRNVTKAPTPDKAIILHESIQDVGSLGLTDWDCDLPGETMVKVTITPMSIQTPINTLSLAQRSKALFTRVLAGEDARADIEMLLLEMRDL